VKSAAAENVRPVSREKRAEFAGGGVTDSICRMCIRFAPGDYTDGNEISFATKEIR
jgi:hypothetical protein